MVSTVSGLQYTFSSSVRENSTSVTKITNSVTEKLNSQSENYRIEFIRIIHCGRLYNEQNTKFQAKRLARFGSKAAAPATTNLPVLTFQLAGMAVELKQRVLSAAKNGDNWLRVAKALDIKYKTAWAWVDHDCETDNWTATPSARGGFRYQCVTPPMIDYLEKRIDDKYHLTLNVHADALLAKFDISVSAQTVKKAIYGRGFTIKTVHQESEYMNTVMNKEKRREYVLALTNHLSEGRKMLYVDETNFNVWCSRGVGRSKGGACAQSGTRVKVSKNAHHRVHCRRRLVNWERLVDSFTAFACQDFMWRPIRHVQQ